MSAVCCEGMYFAFDFLCFLEFGGFVEIFISFDYFSCFAGVAAPIFIAQCCGIFFCLNVDVGIIAFVGLREEKIVLELIGVDSFYSAF